MKTLFDPLPSGRVLGDDVFAGVIGISQDLPGRLFTGYDGPLGEKDDFTDADRRAIADFMILLWQDWAAP